MGSVLIIDAEEEFAQRLANEVRAHGAEPTLTGDGKAGLDMAHINIPDAIVLCVELPRMSGYSICAKLKKDATLKTVPLIITSAEATQETFEHHKKLKTRAEEYLKKPFEPPVLIELLGRYVELGPRDNGAMDDDELLIDAPAVLEDDEAFSSDETLAMVAGEMPPSMVDDAIERLEAQPPPLPHAVSLDAHAGLGAAFEEDEVMTTVGSVPSGSDVFVKELAELKRQLTAEREARASAERERDLAIANEKAAAAQAQAMNASTPPTTAQQSRELLEVKKQLNAKEHELLEMADRVHEKDKQIVALRDREMELEGSIVHAQEAQEVADRARAEAEGKIAAAETKAAEIERSSQQQIDSLNRQLGQAAAHEAELDGALQAKTQEAEELSERLRQREDELAELRRTQQQMSSEITRITNELSAATAEADSLRQQLSDREHRVSEQAARIDALESDLASARGEAESARESLQDAEDRASRAYQRIRDDEETKGKARQALEIAVALLSDEQPIEIDAVEPA